MIKSFLYAFGFAAAAATTILPVSTNAQDDMNSEQGWTALSVGVSFRGDAVSVDELGKTRIADIVYSGTAETPGNLFFNCYNGRPSVSFALEPVDMQALISNPPDSTRMKLRRPKIIVDGKQIKGEDWIYMPAMDVYRMRRVASFRALYNATLTGSDVRIKSRPEDIPLNMPAADDAFKDFGAACGIGRLAER